MSASYYLKALFNNYVPWWQLVSYSMTRPFLPLQRVWLARLQGVIHSPPMPTTHFSQYNASSGALEWPGDVRMLRLSHERKAIIKLFLFNHHRLFTVSRFKAMSVFLWSICTSGWSYVALETWGKASLTHSLGSRPWSDPLISEISMVRALQPANALASHWKWPTVPEMPPLQGEGSGSWACLC